MQVKGTVVSVELEATIAKKDGGNYQGARLSYRDESGKLTEQNWHNNAFKFNAAMKTTLAGFKAGDKIILEKEKNKNDFWEVKSIKKDDGVTSSSATPIASPKSTYETPEERAQKQVYIIRQSSISSAVEYKGNKATTEEIIKAARIFETYVLTGRFDDGSLQTMEGDENEVI